MARRKRGESLLCAVLCIELLIPVPAARAIPSDGSTLFTDRGQSSATGSPASVAPDLVTGAAVHSIAFEAPPGTGGLTPQIALRYSSHGPRQSWVGSGWSLALPAVMRSLERGVPRYDDAVDDFEIDGEKLVPESDTPALPRRWHARRERFERIVQEADGSWTVTSPSGVVRRFGTSANSRIERPADGKPLAWLLSEEEDLNGNVIVASYDRRDPGTAYPAEIRYTLRRAADGSLSSLDGDADRDRSIRFELEPRADVARGHAAGFERVVAHRLRAIHASAHGERIRCFELGYAESPDSFRSLLVAVAEYGSDATCDGTGAPTPPHVTRMSYRTNAAASPSRTGWDGPIAFAWPASLSLVDASREDRGVRMGDVDGDGRPDLLKAYALETPGVGVDGATRSADSGVYLNGPNGFQSTPSAAHPLPVLVGEIGALTTSFARELAGHSIGTGLTAIDLDADGKVDLAGGIRWLDAYGGSVATYGLGGLQRNTGAGFEPATDYGDLATDGRWALSRFGLIDFVWLPNGSGGFYGSFEQRTLPGSARFADLTGDGLPELVVRGTEIRSSWSGYAPPFHPGTRSCRFELSSYHFLNEGGLRFVRAPTFDLPVTSDLCGTDASLRLALDFQPCDPLEPGCQRRLIHDEARSQRFLGDGSYAFWQLHWELGNEAIDLDSDGLADALGAAYDIVLGNESLEASLNTGDGGFVDAPQWRLPTYLYEIDATFARDLGVRLADVNGDGNLDILRAVEGGPHAAWLGDGDAGPGARPGPWSASSEWTLPASLSFVNGAGQDLGLRVVDLDADGMVDLVRSIGGTNEVYRNRGVVPDLLETLTSPLGATVTWRYAPSTSFDHTGNLAAPLEPFVSDGVPRLPHVLQLVTSIRVDPGTAPAAENTFSYQGGVYDPQTREHRGFRTVTATRGDGRVTVTHFHQDEARFGLPEREDVLEQTSGLRRWRSVELRYAGRDDAPPFVSLVAERIETSYDDPAAPRSVASSFRYDAFGNVVERIDWGEVASPVVADPIDLDPGDTRTTEVEMALAASPGEGAPYVVDRVRRQRLRQGPPGAGVVLREVFLRHDGDTTGHAPPLRGLPTATIEARVPGIAAGPTTTREYDEFGNLVAVHPPRANAGQGGGPTRYTYDSRFHAFKSSVVDALGHATTFSTETPLGCESHPAGAGLVQEERGPNLAPGEPGLRTCRDAFGRIVRERGPLDLSDVRIVHHDVPLETRVERYAMTSSGARAHSTTFDGLGRPLLVRSDGPGGRTVLMRRVYDAHGRVVAESEPHFEGEPEPLATTVYDVLDRPVEKTLPGVGRKTTFVFGRSSVRSIDPLGHVEIRHVDPFGRIVRIEAGENAEHVTSYAWDAADRLIELRDPQGHTTSIAYDALGRRIAIVDPDTGSTTFGPFDDEGNLLSRTDGLGVTTFRHDALGRIVERTAGEASVRYTWDTAGRGKGLLAGRSDSAGELRIWAYDAAGRPLADSQETGGATLFFSTRYDALGQVSRRTLATGRAIDFERDPRGFLSAIRAGDAGVIATSIDWDARGNLVAWTAGNGVRTEEPRDAATGIPLGVEIAHAATVLEDLGYGFDAADRLVSIEDRREAGLVTRRFTHDALDRLVRASGPFGSARTEATLHYRYDASGSLLCKDAASETGCSGGTAFEYPATTGSRPAHAPASVGGIPATYDDVGNLVALGERSYGYDPLGRLVNVSAGGTLLATHAYDGEGHRALTTDRSGSRAIERRFVRGDFVWDATRRTAATEITLAGRVIATLVEPFDPVVRSSHVPAVFPRHGLEVLALAPAGASALVLLAWLGVLRRRGVALARPALAGMTALALHVAAVPRALASPDGDLNRDGRLDAADALLASRIASADLEATAEQLAHGDVAPLEEAPTTPSVVDSGDAVLLFRALGGEDVDGDGVATDDELANRSSPFRADTDRDGLSDADELALGTGPDVADTDGDGLDDGAEVLASSDPFTRDTDGDGIEDASDPSPRRGLVYRHADLLGSALLETRESGSGDALVLSRTVHAPYGQAIASVPPERGFTGQRRDPSSGLYDYGARWYDPALGRFLQPDSLVPDPFRPRSHNRYAYAEGAPTDRVDPTGHASLRVFAGTLGPSGFTGVGVDFAWSRGFVAVDAWGAVDGVQRRLARLAEIGGLRFSEVLNSPYPDGWWGKGTAARAREERAQRAYSAGLPPIELPNLAVSDLRPADILLTGDGGGAGILRFAGADRGEHLFGHAGLVLDVRGDTVHVFSADQTGAYRADNANSGVGNRSWAVYRPPPEVDRKAVLAFAYRFPVRQGLLGKDDAYLDGAGASVCSSLVARALEAGGATPVSRGPLQIVTPGALRAYGRPVGQVRIGGPQ